jgi:hypothetical protein
MTGKSLQAPWLLALRFWSDRKKTVFARLQEKVTGKSPE